MIFTERKITVRKGKSSIDEPVILYRGDYEVELRFTIMESKYRFKSGVNLVDSEKAAHAQLALLAPDGANVFTEIGRCEDGTAIFVLSKEMIDELSEVGLYSFQIRLFDYYRESRITIPPIEFGIEVREPIAAEDHTNAVDQAMVGYSIAKTSVLDEPVPETFNASGQYNKTDWETGDRISEGKLNKIEDALRQINQNEKNDVDALDKRVTSNFNTLNSTKADKNEIFSMKNMGQDVKEAMTGGSVAVVGDNTILTNNIVNKQITTYKTDFIISTEAKFDKYACEDGAITVNGSLTTGDSWTTSGYILILAGESYTINAVIGFFALYDLDYKIIPESFIKENIRNKVVSVERDCYMRFSFVYKLESYAYYQPLDTISIMNVNGERLMLSLPLGSELSDNSVTGDKLVDNCIEPRHFGVVTDVLWYKDYNPVNGYVVISGTITGNSAYSYNELYIPVEPNTNYVVRYAPPQLCSFYDSDHNYVSEIRDLGVTVIRENVVITTPQEGYYVRINTRKEHALLQCMVKGTEMPSDEELTRNVSKAPWLQTDILPDVKEALKNDILNDVESSGGNSTIANEWMGKTFVSLGDSITWQDGNTYGQGAQQGLKARGWQTIVKEKLGFSSYTNKAISGRPISNGSANGVGTNTTAKTFSYSSFDLVVIAGGTNDFKLNIPLGVLGNMGDANFDTNTFYGAYRDMLEYILKEKPTIRICLFTPLQRDNGNYNINTTNTAGHKLIDYVNAIKDIGQMYGIPVCDMYANSGITKLNLSTYTMDGLHPNDTGYIRMGGYASMFISNINP